MQFNYLDDFLRDLKKLKKKIPSLTGDLENFERALPVIDFDNNKRFITITKDESKGVRIIKTRLMVRSLKGSSKTRIVFSFCLRKDSVDFIEIYMKNEKSREDTERIDDYLDSLPTQI